MLSAIGSIIDSNDPKEIEEIAKQVVDPAGTFYKFSLADSLLRRSRNE
jgi:F420-non-reducing hydrogenase small subunit